MDKGTVREHARTGKSGNRAHTNSGRFLSLQADYRAGRLTVQGEQRYEAVVLELGRLYRALHA